MIVVCERCSPRSAIISTRSRKLSLKHRYQRTQRMITHPGRNGALQTDPSCLLTRSSSAHFFQIITVTHSPLLFAPEPAIAGSQRSGSCDEGQGADGDSEHGWDHRERRTTCSHHSFEFQGSVWWASRRRLPCSLQGRTNGSEILRHTACEEARSGRHTDTTSEISRLMRDRGVPW